MAVFDGNLTPSALGACVALGLGIVPFALRALGGGDVKATIVVGVFVGPAGVLKILLFTALLCGTYAAAWWSIQRFISLKYESSIPVALPLALATWGMVIVG